jgi:hypothetical protein
MNPAARASRAPGRADSTRITLNARQHIRVNGGLRIPVTDRQNRSNTVMVYLLWDWFDGGFFTGW